MTRRLLPDEPLEDGVVRLRPWRPDEAEWYAAMAPDSEIQLWTSVAEDLVPADVRAAIERMWTYGDLAGLLITDVATGERLGNAALGPSTSDPDTGDISYWLAPAARGRGVATRAVRLLTGWAWRCGMRRVVASVAVDDVASQRVVERAGLVRQGVTPYRVVKGLPRTVVEYALGRPVWPVAEAVTTARLVLEPLRVEHAPEMAMVLHDPRVHDFIGGWPATEPELRSRYARMVVGQSPDGGEGWLNWVVRQRDTGEPVGTVQATVTGGSGSLTAELAWIVGVAWQGRGYAAEATTAMAGWLERQGIRAFVAHIHPRHDASARVARRVGLSPTEVVEDGETLWSSGDAGQESRERR